LGGDGNWENNDSAGAGQLSRRMEFKGIYTGDFSLFQVTLGVAMPFEFFPMLVILPFLAFPLAWSMYTLSPLDRRSRVVWLLQVFDDGPKEVVLLVGAYWWRFGFLVLVKLAAVVNAQSVLSNLQKGGSAGRFKVLCEHVLADLLAKAIIEHISENNIILA
jgi:hypothetical protein